MNAAIEKAGSWLGALPARGAERSFEVIGKMPTTQFRIVVTIVMMLGTAAKYWMSATWQPSVPWLGFLSVMAGVDTAQHVAGRLTDYDYITAKNGTIIPPPPTPTHDTPSPVG